MTRWTDDKVDCCTPYPPPCTSLVAVSEDNDQRECHSRTLYSNLCINLTRRSVRRQRRARVPFTHSLQQPLPQPHSSQCPRTTTSESAISRTLSLVPLSQRRVVSTGAAIRDTDCLGGTHSVVDTCMHLRVRTVSQPIV